MISEPFLLIFGSSKKPTSYKNNSIEHGIAFILNFRIRTEGQSNGNGKSFRFMFKFNSK